MGKKVEKKLWFLPWFMGPIAKMTPEQIMQKFWNCVGMCMCSVWVCVIQISPGWEEAWRNCG